MEYRVTSLSKEEFLRLWDLVLIARGDIRYPIPYHPVALYRVSERLEDFCETDRPAISGDEYVGMYYHDGQIWLKPDQPYSEMQDTALHELAHHEIPDEAHGPKWRKVYGTALALHLRESGYGWDETRYMLYAGVVAPNRVFRKIDHPEEQRRIIRAEVNRIIRNAKEKLPILTQRGHYG